MNRKELVEAIASKTGLSKKDAGAALSAALEAIEDSLKAGDKVQLVGFGTFEVKNRAERTSRNPRTREEICVPACKVVAWKTGNALKRSINE